MTKPLAILADIGGTNARFALLFDRPGQGWGEIAVLPCRDYPTIEAAIRDFARRVEVSVLPPLLIAIANPVVGDAIKMTNHDWAFSISALAASLGTKVRVVNDFTALAHALPFLKGDCLRPLGEQGASAVEHPAVKGVVGAGTGLGVSGLIPYQVGADCRWRALESEGGHVAFAPASVLELDILRWLWREGAVHTSAERLVSGPGLELIHRAIRAISGEGEGEHSVADIARHLSAATCQVCSSTVSVFSALLGTVAANLAVTLGARGGIYVGGGVVGKLGQAFDALAFRQRFENKGRLSGYMRSIPTLLITDPYPAFWGLQALFYQSENVDL